MLIIDKNKLIIKDLKLIQSLQNNVVVVITKNKTVKVFGENIGLSYLEYNELHIEGIIKRIELYEK